MTWCRPSPPPHGDTSLAQPGRRRPSDDVGFRSHPTSCPRLEAVRAIARPSGAGGGPLAGQLVATRSHPSGCATAMRGLSTVRSWPTPSPLAATSPPERTGAAAAATRWRPDRRSTCRRVRPATAGSGTSSPTTTPRASRPSIGATQVRDRTQPAERTGSRVSWVSSMIVETHRPGHDQPSWPWTM